MKPRSSTCWPSRADILAAQPTAQDMGAPFRFDPSTNPAGDRRWYVVNAAEVGSGQDNIGRLGDSSAPRLAGKFGLTFRVEPGFVICSTAR